VAFGVERVWNTLWRYQAYGIVVGREVQVSPPWSGEIEAVHVREGDHVVQGALLFTLSNLGLHQDRTRLLDELRIAQADLAAELVRLEVEAGERDGRAREAAAEYYAAWGDLLEEEARLDVLQQRLERQMQLFTSEIVTLDAIEQLREEAGGQCDKVAMLHGSVEALRVRAEAVIGKDLDERLRPYALRVELLQADLERLGERLAQGEVRAPVPGKILRRDGFVGEQAGMDRVLVTILEDGSEQVELFVSQEAAAGLSPGLVLELELAPRVGVVRCRVESIGSSFAQPPPGVGRFSIVGEQLLPVRLTPIHDPDAPLELRVGALAKLPRHPS
jgi:multidrug resistance efflux pump